MNVKGASYRKTKRILVIVCSNYSMEDCYKHAIEKDDKIIDSLKSRFFRY